MQSECGKWTGLMRFATSLCDLQEKFRSAIYEFDKVVSTSEKMIKAGTSPSGLSITARTRPPQCLTSPSTLLVQSPHPQSIYSLHTVCPLR